MSEAVEHARATHSSVALLETKVEEQGAALAAVYLTTKSLHDFSAKQHVAVHA